MLQNISPSGISKEYFWTIPNILSLYRLLSFPLVLYWALTFSETLFIIFLCVNLVTDILDGLTARILNQQTSLGAKLDAWADLGMYITAFTGIYFFKRTLIQPHSFIFLFFFLARISSYGLAFFKFGKLIGLHTWMTKSTGYLQGIFIFTLFVFQFYIWLYYWALIWGIIGCIEELIILWLLPTPQSNVRGLYWLYNNRS